MTLDELKSDWQQPVSPKSSHEIQQMISQKASSVFYRTKLKVIIETVAFVVLVLVFMTGLDPERNASWVNIVLLLVAAVGITNNLWLYRRLSATVLNDNIKTSLIQFKKKLQEQMLFAIVFSSLLFGSVFLFFFLRVPLTAEKVGLLIMLLILSIGIRSGIEVWRWQKHIHQIDDCLSSLNH